MLAGFFKLFGSLLGFIALAFGAIAILPSNKEKIFGLPIASGFLLLFAYGAFVGFIFLLLARYFFRFPPVPEQAIQAQNKLQDEIREYFNSANNQGKVFEIEEDKNQMTITWSAELKYNQLVAIGNIKKKSAFKLDFNPQAHTVTIITTEKNIDWQAGASGFNFSANYFQGIPLEYETKIVPSFEIVDGKPKIIIKNLTYNSNSILNPIVTITNRNGWTAGFSIANPWLDKLFLILTGLLIIASIIFAIK